MRRPSEISREQERRRLGLRPELPLGLVMFGGFGSRRMLTVARRVAEAGVKTQLIFLCGHNQRLRAQLSGDETAVPVPRRGLHAGDPPLDAVERLLCRQAGTRQRQRGAGDGPAGDRRAQRADHGAGALQYRMDRAASVRRGAALVQRNRGRNQADARRRRGSRTFARAPARSTIAPCSKFPTCSRRLSPRRPAKRTPLLHSKRWPDRKAPGRAPRR